MGLYHQFWLDVVLSWHGWLELAKTFRKVCCSSLRSGISKLLKFEDRYHHRRNARRSRVWGLTLSRLQRTADEATPTTCKARAHGRILARVSASPPCSSPRKCFQLFLIESADGFATLWPRRIYCCCCRWSRSKIYSTSCAATLFQREEGWGGVRSAAEDLAYSVSERHVS